MNKGSVAPTGLLLPLPNMVEENARKPPRTGGLAEGQEGGLLPGVGASGGERNYEYVNGKKFKNR